MSKNRNGNITAQNVTLKNIIVSSIVALAGFALLYIASEDKFWENSKSWQTVIRQLGSLFFVSIAINILWQLFGKRAFLNEILDKAKISYNIAKSGVLLILDDFHSDEIDWKSHIQNAYKIDIFFAYAHSWRGKNLGHLLESIKKGKVRVRVVLSEPEDEILINEFCRSWDKTKEEIRAYINEAITDFKTLNEKAKQYNSTVEVWLLSSVPKYTMYRFDNTYIITFYTHQKGRYIPIPTILSKIDGSLAKFFYGEFNEMVKEKGIAKKIEW